MHSDLPAQINTDEQRLGQIVKNLLNNAAKFTREGSVTLRLRRPSAEEIQQTLLPLEVDDAVAICVEDTGIGIAEAKRSIIFEAFAQADGATDREYGGTGLGLSISRQLAKLLGGDILLESEEGKGSRFTVILPEQPASPSEEKTTSLPHEETTLTLTESGGPTHDQGTEALEGENARGGNGGSPDLQSIPDDRRTLCAGDRSVLIIEDDPAFAKVLLDLARERDYKGLVAPDALNGLHLADYYLPSAILLDLGLPGMDGLAVIRRLKENLRTRHIPVHVVSGQDHKFASLKLGAHGYVRKPINMQELDSAFERLEHVISKPVKTLLFVGGENDTSSSIVDFIGDKDVRITTVTSKHDALRTLESTEFDCLVIDCDLPDATGAELLESVRRNGVRSDIPAIVLAGPDTTTSDQLTLDRYADRIIAKDQRVQERLLDETTLFLHRVEKDLPEEKRRIIRMMHDKEAIFRNKKLLVVDDDMRNVFALSSILEEKAVELLVAKDGVEALECLEERPDVDLVLMDIMMPRMDGYEAMRAIRKQERFRDLPIIALTAKAMKGDRAKCITAGASDYLAKPVDTDKLLSMLRVWLYE
jgi:CheY-like chemotaxis protein